MLQLSAAPLTAMLKALGEPGKVTQRFFFKSVSFFQLFKKSFRNSLVFPSLCGRGEGRAQEHAAEALILAASDVSTRQRWIEGEGDVRHTEFSCVGLGFCLGFLELVGVSLDVFDCVLFGKDLSRFPFSLQFALQNSPLLRFAVLCCARHRGSLECSQRGGQG